MKSIRKLVALVAFSIPMAAVAAPRHSEVKVPAQVVLQSAFPDCADGMEPGTICRYVPVSAVTFNVRNVVPDRPVLPIKILLPPGFRSIQTTLHFEVSPTAACDPAPSEIYEGEGGLTIDCSPQ